MRNIIINLIKKAFTVLRTATTIVVIFAVILALVWLLIEPIINWTNLSELRLYVRIFLLLFTISTFAVLRLYNSIVQNTRFSIKLREAMLKTSSMIPGLERSIKNLSNTIGSVKTSIEANKKSTDNNSEKFDKFMEKLNRSK